MLNVQHKNKRGKNETQKGNGGKKMFQDMGKKLQLRGGCAAGSVICREALSSAGRVGEKQISKYKEGYVGREKKKPILTFNTSVSPAPVRLDPFKGREWNKKQGSNENDQSGD